ncbi:MAG TPA: nucleoside triphosphate pyrophosphatase [Legionellaceae bacterium]|nr:nucleoside triphosphate pyrophosphatase [Legionellaceae bacterium]
MTIYLASKSPRRKELLQQMEIPFEVLTVDIPEIVQVNEVPESYSKRITQEKLHAAWNKITQEHLPRLPILCADTEVVLDGIILGKPNDEEDAFHMLKQYSGKTHQVFTSVGFIYEGYETIRMQTTQITFAEIPDKNIRHYLASGNYKDKSGGYGIQSYIGQFISHIDGCFYSVMGLPLNTVREMLIDLNDYLLQSTIQQ